MDDQTDPKIKELEERCAELENNWKRALADYKNFEKRVMSEKLTIMDFANENLLADMLPVLDNLEMLSIHLNDMGLKLTLNNLKQVLADYGVKEIDATNKDFDSASMEAIETAEGEKGKVLEILTKGYTLKDKLLRPARVKVGNGESQKGSN